MNAHAQNRDGYVGLNESNYQVGDKIELPAIVFSTCCQVLTDEQFLDSVQVIADFLKEHPQLKVEIAAFTDSRGTADKNVILSQKRAEAVRNTLVENFNCNPVQIVTKGYGEDVPLITDAEIKALETKEEKENRHQKNRRVELKVLEVLD